MRFKWRGTALALAAVAATAGAAAANEQPILRDIAGAPDPVQLQATVQALVGFGTRHTLSDTTSPRRGIGAARRWAQARFVEIGRGCGGCLTIVTPAETVTGERVTKPAEIVDVVAIQKGTTDPERDMIFMPSAAARQGRGLITYRRATFPGELQPPTSP